MEFTSVAVVKIVLIYEGRYHKPIIIMSQPIFYILNYITKVQVTDLGKIEEEEKNIKSSSLLLINFGLKPKFVDPPNFNILVNGYEKLENFWFTLWPPPSVVNIYQIRSAD